MIRPRATSRRSAAAIAGAQPSAWAIERAALRSTLIAVTLPPGVTVRQATAASQTVIPSTVTGSASLPGHVLQSGGQPAQ